jgi:hypothetical protein
MSKYWDLYVLYLERCKTENYINAIRPNPYETEWNHFWPKSIFGNWPVGQYLTVRQHAIASALQTLVFKENCMCAWHKQYLPPKLLELAWPYFHTFTKENGKKSVPRNKKKVIVTLPDNSQRYFDSINEVSQFLNVNRTAILFRIRKGPPHKKSKLFGYRFELAEGCKE